MTLEKFVNTFNEDSKIYKVFAVLRDRQWHCRECEYVHVQSSQIAGGSGIQGLQRGSRSRPGMVIESDNHFCQTCDKQTRHDRWTGNFEAAINEPSMPQAFVRRAVHLLGSRDIVDGTARQPNQLTVDHKLPTLRWNEETAEQQINYGAMTDDDIRHHFQLLKKSNGTTSHNLLKSRACESCYKTGRRGKPFGIDFFYEGSSQWQPADKKNASGCIGCGWYDIDAWRTNLNAKLQENN